VLAPSNDLKVSLAARLSSRKRRQTLIRPYTRVGALGLSAWNLRALYRYETGAGRWRACTEDAKGQRMNMMHQRDDDKESSPRSEICLLQTETAKRNRSPDPSRAEATGAHAAAGSDKAGAAMLALRASSSAMDAFSRM
jgi:hypothetical protein